MRNSQFKGAWRLLTHPVMVVIWCVLAVVVPMYISYLATPTRYVIDFYLMFFVLASMIGVAWLMNLMAMPMVNVNLIVPLLGLVSFVSLLSDIGDEIHYWAAFQWHVPWLDGVIQLILMLLFLLLLRALLKRVTGEIEHVSSSFWLIIALPFLMLMVYGLLDSYQFFADAHGRVAVFHHGLSPWILPQTEINSVDSFLIENINR